MRSAAGSIAIDNGNSSLAIGLVLDQAGNSRFQGSAIDVGAFEANLGRVAGGEVLHMHRRRDDRARNAETLGNVAFHLRAQHQLGTH